MGRITAYDQNGRTVADFDKGEYDLMHGWVGTEMERLRIENGKLRELVGDVCRILFSLNVDYCGACAADNINHQCPVYTVEGGECLYKTCMRELGIEVKA